MILPSRPLLVPRVIRTSSSLRMGIERTYKQTTRQKCSVNRPGKNRTLCFSRSSLLRGALMMVRRTLEGAEKCALRDFLLEE